VHHLKSFKAITGAPFLSASSCTFTIFFEFVALRVPP